MVIVDTNVVIDHLRLKGQKDSFLVGLSDKYSSEPMAISIVSVQELFEGKSTKNDEAERFLFTTLSPLKILPYTYEVAKKAGEIIRDVKSNMEFADAAIAATAILNHAEFATLNKKDYSGIADLQLI